MTEATTRGRCAYVAALLLAVACAPAALGQASVKMELDAAETYVNEPLTITISVSDFESCDPPIFPEIAGVTVRALPQSADYSQTVIINGRMTSSRSRTYSYELIASSAGEIVIPAIEVTVDDRTLRTEPRRITVHPSDADKLLSVEISAGRKRVYVGQSVHLDMTIWVKAVSTQGGYLRPTELMSMRLLSAVDLGPFPGNDITSDVQRREMPDGSSEVYYKYTLAAEYVPDRPGPLSLDNVEVSLRYPTQMSRTVFGDWRVHKVRNLRARAKVEDVEVMPLPMNGRPANFTGAVGRYGITVIAEPTAVRVGDPIKLTIEIGGDGPVESLPAPDLAADPLLTQGFRVPQEELAGEVVGNRRRFTQVIRAERADLTEIPPIEYPYFNPDQGLYAVALSEPIPLTVSEAAQLDTASLVRADSPAASEEGGALRALDGLRGNKTRESELLSTAPAVSLNNLALATFTPPAVFLVAWGWTTYMRRRSPSQHRRQHALRTARRRLDQARGPRVAGGRRGSRGGVGGLPG